MCKKIASVMLSCLFLILFCGKNDKVTSPDLPEKGLPRKLTKMEKTLISNGSKFGFKLFREVVNQEGDKNIFISPLSVSMALGMTLNGANTTTEEAMKSTLEFTGMTEEEINKSYQSLINLLLDLDPLVIMEIANSIWYREGFTVEEDFINLNKTYFDAEVEALNFSSPEAVNTINSWVNNKTHGKIDEIIERIETQVMMYLINAMYFKGTWTVEFDPENTKDDVFTTSAGSEITCKMMNTESKLRYQENDLFQAVDLLYGVGNYSMTLLLPKEGIDTDEIITQMSETNWNSWTGNFSERNVNLFLPKFKLEYKIGMKEVLSTLGMEIAFQPGNADFTDINTNGDLFLSRVLHKTYVDVNEIGTEAAAVTAVEVSLTSTGGNSVTIRVDRPFIFVIRETNSGTILFIGKINEPIS